MRGYDNDHVISLGLSDIVPVAGFNIDPSDSLLVWDIGYMAAGQTVSFSYTRELSSTITGLNSVFTFANEVPEPGSLALIGLGLAGLAAIRKRKQA